MLLNILLTRMCGNDCLFCIEKTKEDTEDDSTLDTFLRKANHLIDNSLVDEVLLLGGEPLSYGHIFEIIEGLHIKPIITTSAYPLLDSSFFTQMDFQKIKAMNISVPHYDQVKRREMMGGPCLSDSDLSDIVGKVGIPIRMNTVLMRDYIGS
jgi:molybdenum cofactor biosynthesis enzyme MoaA